MRVLAASLLLTLPIHASALTTKTASPSAAARPMVVPFVEDDYGKALEQARARKLPIFVEVWAPW